jgi:hypothetical protein
MSTLGNLHREPAAWEVWVGADTPLDAPMGWQRYSIYESKRQAEVFARTVNSYQVAPFAKIIPLWRHDYAGDVCDIAPPTPKPTILEGFTPWYGGECPVGEWDEVRFVLRSGGEEYYISAAQELRWKHLGYGGDIIAYRVLKRRVKIGEDLVAVPEHIRLLNDGANKWIAIEFDNKNDTQPAITAIRKLFGMEE